MPEKCNRRSHLANCKGGNTMAEDETTTIKLKTKKAILEHIRDEPRYFFMVGHTDETEELLEPLKGKHDGDLILELKAGNLKLELDVVEVQGYVSVRKKFIDGRRWRHYYGLKFRKPID